MQFFLKFGPSKESQEIWRNLFVWTKKVIKGNLKYSKVFLFGSTPQNTYLQKSDIDIVVLTIEENSELENANLLIVAF